MEPKPAPVRPQVSDLFRARLLVGLADQAAVQPLNRVANQAAMDRATNAGLALEVSGVRDVTAEALVILANPARWTPRRLAQAFWQQYTPAGTPHPTTLRILVNPPAYYVWRMAETPGTTYAFGQFLDEDLPDSLQPLELVGTKGSVGTRHADDVTIFWDEGLSEATLDKLASYLIPGSTVTVFKPGDAHQFWLKWGNLGVPGGKLIARLKQYKLAPLHSAGQAEGYAHQVFSVSAA